MAPTFKVGDWVRRTSETHRHTIGAYPFQVQEVVATVGVLDPNGQWHDPRFLALCFAPVETPLPMGNTFRDYPTTLPLVPEPIVIHHGAQPTDPGIWANGQGAVTVVTGPADDPVNSPSHYVQNGIEVIDVIDAFGHGDDWRMGNVTKYILRSKLKGNELQDLEKAARLLASKIQLLKDAK